MADHIDDVAAVSSLVRALLHERFTGEDDDPARRALLDRMASLRAATAHWASEFRRARDEGQAAAQAFAGAAKELHDLRTALDAAARVLRKDDRFLCHNDECMRVASLWRRDSADATCPEHADEWDTEPVDGTADLVLVEAALGRGLYALPAVQETDTKESP